MSPADDARWLPALVAMGKAIGCAEEDVERQKERIVALTPPPEPEPPPKPAPKRSKPKRPAPRKRR